MLLRETLAFTINGQINKKSYKNNKLKMSGAAFFMRYSILF